MNMGDLEDTANVTAIRATVHAGQLTVTVPPDWPEGLEVEIHPIGESDVMTPEDIARTLAAMDRVEPFDMTDSELAAWEAELKTRKAREKAGFTPQLERLGKTWE